MKYQVLFSLKNKIYFRMSFATNSLCALSQGKECNGRNSEERN